MMEEFRPIKPRTASITHLSEFKRFFVSKSHRDTGPGTVGGLRLSDNGSKMCLLL
jgi:hypothetical protein